ncbi:hypothetical protein P153DRAFT_394327 [Dothidotthia symphoricarpi CBS 119687]|uniref:F-box domain-containing protein n=1 Tax=Dothidotthia symphoricarpi CBS 119687 TaxID=1392245 RepID=A0A6A6AJL1_9PLEO|nr:uncharacterized protein P153DRAFT_394327 [Dothidotthia symphoricarpi CBS 119687]KAF2132162.1 hypothetical protein P153DRAFT_394327 [Dothidotthia symphoricarpi CBS 119687]
MDDALPSYESAIQRDPWVFIAPYLSAEALCAAALVCRKWHAIFTPQLWGNPSSHFRLQNDTVYIALTHFMRTLPHARLFVREFTHTLHFPPTHAETYGGPHADWLRDCHERLPNLQCLIVNGLPFFDHASLLTLKHPSLPDRFPTFPTFALRLLDASGCVNATTTGLAEALCHFPELVSLDLSRTLGARGEAVLRVLGGLRKLRVLNVRRLGLRDGEFEVLARAIGKRVRSLDVSENQLTDASIRLLLDHCVEVEEMDAGSGLSPGLTPFHEHNHASRSTEAFESEGLVGHIRRKLTGGFLDSLVVEEVMGIGVTHLYLSGNTMTVKGISELLRSGRLHVLDVGVLSDIPEISHRLGLSGVTDLTPILSECASAQLRYLRINYRVVTEDTPFVESKRNPELHVSSTVQESDSSKGALKTQPATTIPHHNSTHYVEDRRARLDLRQSQEPRLHPGMLPKVQTLVLTAIPTSTTDKKTIDRLIQYIQDAAAEASTARQQAKHTYALPPGRERTVAEREHAQSIFALRRIVLEIAPPQATAMIPNGARGGHAMRSATEDADSEAFWEASARDFSFFADEQEPSIDLVQASKVPAQPQKEIPSFDVVAEIGRFRRERKAAHDALVKAEATSAEIEGYWPGYITVVRKTLDGDAGAADHRGNRYEEGWYYQ